MNDRNDMNDQELDQLLRGRTVPRASQEFLQRLQDIPGHYAQAPRREVVVAGFADQMKALWRALSPAQLLTQSGAMAAALVVGLWLGMGEQSPVVAEEVDVAHWLADGDLDIYEESESE